MAGILIKDFTGTIPIRDVRALPDNAAASAIDQRPNTGALEPIRNMRLITAVAGATRCAYRIPQGDAYSDNLAQDYWWQFSDRDTDVVRGPSVNDSFKRHYFCSPSTGLRFAAKADILAGNGQGASYRVGVQRPTAPPVVTPDETNAKRDPKEDTNGDGVIDGADDEGDLIGPITTRAYVVTFINTYGEESGPSPAAEASAAVDAIWRVTNVPQPTQPGGYVPVNKIRLYRTVTATSGATVFNFVADLNVGQTSYDDTITDAIVSGTTQLPSTDADVPPDGLQGLALMPNGILVAFKDNNLYFSDNFKSWSWPAAYTLTVPHRVVGLAVIGNTCVVCTGANPCTVTGSTGATMSLTANASPLPCLNRQSIAVAPEGAYWASYTGIVLYTVSGAAVVSDEIIGREKWSSAFNPPTVDAVYAYGMYAGLYTRRDNGQVGGFGFGSGCVVNYKDLNAAVGAGIDVGSGKPWLIVNGGLYEWQPADTAYKSVVWTSKQFQTQKPVNMGALQVEYDPVQGVTQVHVRVFGRGGKLRFDADVGAGVPKRMSSGYRDDIYQVEITANTPVRRFVMGQSIEDLKNV